jgi:hypothetical protein
MAGFQTSPGHCLGQSAVSKKDMMTPAVGKKDVIWYGKIR